MSGKGKKIAILCLVFFAVCFCYFSCQIKSVDIPVIDDLEQLRFAQVSPPKNVAISYNFSLRNSAENISPIFLDVKTIQTIFGEIPPKKSSENLEISLRMTTEKKIDELSLIWSDSDYAGQELEIRVNISENPVPEYLQDLSDNSKSIYKNVEIAAFTYLNTSTNRRYNLVNYKKEGVHYLIVSRGYDIDQIIPYVQFFVDNTISVKSL